MVPIQMFNNLKHWIYQNLNQNSTSTTYSPKANKVKQVCFVTIGTPSVFRL
jgi:UDP-glucose 6-dehydrogenase